jgi:hypothetical protein
LTENLLEKEIHEGSGEKPIPHDPFRNLARKQGTWDRGVDYTDAKLFFEHKVRTEKDERKYSNWATLLIQLTNAARISEAVEAFNRFLETGERDLQVKVSKKKREDLRRVVVSFTIEQRGQPRCEAAVKMFAMRRGINTHSLRYALVGYLSVVKKEPPQVIAKITHHSKLDMILRYTQQLAADKILDETTK